MEVSEIAIFGHSMGGLLTRSANHYAQREGASYVELVRHVIHSGSPQHGAGLERLANRGGSLLGLLPESASLAGLLNGRSAGIKDMRYGNVVDEDWRGFDPDELWTDRRTAVPFLEGANHYFLAATHFHLTAPPAVYEQLRQWLAPRELPAGDA